MLAIRRAGRGASYVPWRAGEVPWHSAMAATYAHCTAPLRRLADRYVLQAILAIANGSDRGPMAEWLRTGLQIRLRRFDSGSGLQGVT
jgi:exoribonuclease R